MASPRTHRTLFAARDLTRDQAEEAASRLASLTAADAERVLKRSVESTVLVAELPHLGRIVVKQAPAPPAIRRLIAAVPGARRLRSRLTRQRDGADVLRGAGINAARTLLHIRASCAPGRATELLVIEPITHDGALARNLLAFFNDHPPGHPDRASAAHAAGALVAALTGAALRNRDHKPSNILVAKTPPASHNDLCIIDTVGIEKATPDSATRMLFNLYIECLGTRTRITPKERGRALRAALPGSTPALRRDAWHRIEAHVRAHGDPTPKDNPLTPADG